MITRIANNVYSVGVSNWDTRTFHGHEMSTARGTTYNAYLIIDEKEIVLIDTVATDFFDEFVANLRTVVDPARITAVISQHAEPDHGGSLGLIKQLAPGARIFCSKRGTDSIPGHHHPAEWPLNVVDTGDTLDCGAMKITFFMAAMCHWPDSMMSHLGGPDILFSNDAFGQHFATPALFDDQSEAEKLWFEAEKYFCNIIMPYGRNVLNRLDELEKLALPVKMIAPSHGAIWRKQIGEILQAYRRWAAQQTDERVVIAYDTMYESTRHLADAITEGLRDENLPYSRHHAAVTDRSDLLTDMFGARGLLFGSPTWQMTVLPSIATLLEDLKTLRFKNRLVGAFGSYGWQKSCVQNIEQRARDAGLEVPVEGVAAQWRPCEQDLELARQFGRRFAQAVKG